MKSGKELRDIAMSEVERNAHEKWKEAALEAIRVAATLNTSFIVDAVWPHIEEGVVTHENRAIGPMMARAKKLGWIEPTSEFRLSIVPSHHATPRRVWKSKITARVEAPQMELQM